MDEAKADTAYKMAQQATAMLATYLAIWRSTHHLRTLAIPRLPGQTMKQNLAAKKKQLNTMKQECTLQSGPCFCKPNVWS
jgi:hypothetical protein